MNDLGNHLWQSSVFAAAVAVAAFLLRKNCARVRFWLWFAASLKFLIPFSLLVSAGSRVELPPAPAPVVSALAVAQISTSFEPVAVSPSSVRWPMALGVIWLVGVLALALRWTRSWMELHRLRRRARPLTLAFPIPVLETDAAVEPGIFGLIRPVLLLPEGLERRLTPEQLAAVLAHERSHVESRDNLTGALHVAVTTLFWFHPAVWWIGRRLIEERERACDEAVLSGGQPPVAYAESILSICRFYRETPLPCASGVTGADLKRRIREIMASRAGHRLSPARKALLVAAGVSALSVPVAIGILRAQTQTYTYEVVSIRPGNPSEDGDQLGPGPQGGIRTVNTPVMQLMTFAYDARSYQFVNAPSWLNSARYDVTFTPDRPEEAPDHRMPRAELQAIFNRNRQRMQAVLRDRFGLVVRAETREMPMYALTVDRGGLKMKTSSPTAQTMMSSTQRRIKGTAVNLKMVTESLAMLAGRYVVDETGLDGLYDIELDWTKELEQGADPSVFTVITEQLGLKLVSKRGPVPVFVVEKVEKPSEN